MKKKKKRNNRDTNSHIHIQSATAEEKQTLSTLLVSCAVSYKNKTGEVQTQ